jgi:hypothetical protein
MRGWEVLMGALMLRCPTTGLEFSTGIFADEETFKKLPDTVTKSACPHCGRLHTWWTREARLSESEPNQRLAG